MTTNEINETKRELLNGKKLTSDSWTNPDEMYYFYDKDMREPFRFTSNIDGGSLPIASFDWVINDLREVKNYMNKTEVLEALIEGKKITSDECKYPDEDYWYFDKNKKNPVVYVDSKKEGRNDSIWDYTKHREVKEKVKEKPYINPETGIKDKSFVEAWNEGYKFNRLQCFYDAINNCAFTGFNGNRKGEKFQNYKVIKNIPKWARKHKAELK